MEQAPSKVYFRWRRYGDGKVSPQFIAQRVVHDEVCKFSSVVVVVDGLKVRRRQGLGNFSGRGRASQQRRTPLNSIVSPRSLANSGEHPIRKRKVPTSNSEHSPVFSPTRKAETKFRFTAQSCRKTANECRPPGTLTPDSGPGQAYLQMHHRKEARAKLSPSQMQLAPPSATRRPHTGWAVCLDALGAGRFLLFRSSDITRSLTCG